MRKRAMPVEHVCGKENCGRIFRGRANAVYCSKRCREAATKRRHRARPKPAIHIVKRMGYRPGDPNALSLCGLRGRILTESIENVTCTNCLRMYVRPGRVSVLRLEIGPFGQQRWFSR